MTGEDDEADEKTSDKDSEPEESPEKELGMISKKSIIYRTSLTNHVRTTDG